MKYLFTRDGYRLLFVKIKNLAVESLKKRSTRTDGVAGAYKKTINCALTKNGITKTGASPFGLFIPYSGKRNVQTDGVRL
jgi:hypothetical protein